jgi:hypothetical protein
MSHRLITPRPQKALPAEHPATRYFDLICADYLTMAGPRWRDAFDFVSPADEPVIRKFFTDMIGQFSELARKERGR